jgi:DNA-binding HxlR family transcriptional regulator
VRSYRQYCSLARALDLVGERWTLLIVRELFVRDSRYSDLRDGLPGIASNLLADRLRDLEGQGIIEAYSAPRPVSATLYRLTERGRALGPVLQALLQWGARLPSRPQGEDTFRMHWMTLGLPRLFDGVELTDLGNLSVLVDAGDQPAVLRLQDGKVEMTLAGSAGPSDVDVVVEGPADAVFELLTGITEPRDSSPVAVSGPAPAVRRLRQLARRCTVGTTPR